MFPINVPHSIKLLKLLLTTSIYHLILLQIIPSFLALFPYPQLHAILLMNICIIVTHIHIDVLMLDVIHPHITDMVIQLTYKYHMIN